jgi:lysophospholipase L1-like esterase
LGSHKMGINTTVSNQYQGVVQTAGSPQSTSTYTPAGLGLAGSTQVNCPSITRFASIGDSITAGTANGNSYIGMFTLINNGIYFDCGNFGASGERSDQILLRVNSVIASGARTVFVQCGINDIVQGVPEATLRANCIAIWTAFANAGIQVIDVGLPPTNTGANVPRYVQHNLWRSLYCSFNGIRHFSIWPLLATNAGAFATGLFTDAIHPNTAGAYTVATALTTFVNSNKFGSATLALTDSATDNGSAFGNTVTWANTGGLPTAWFQPITSGVIVPSVVAPDANSFGSWARSTLTTAVDAGLESTGVTLASLGWAIGDRIFLGCRYRWVDASQSLTNNILYLTPAVNQQAFFQVKGGVTGGDVIVQAISTITGGTLHNMDFRASGTGYFELNRPICVNLTKMGL